MRVGLIHSTSTIEPLHALDSSAKPTHLRQSRIPKLCTVGPCAHPSEPAILPQRRSVYRLRRHVRREVKDGLVRILAAFPFEPTSLGACKGDTCSSESSNRDARSKSGVAALVTHPLSGSCRLEVGGRWVQVGYGGKRTHCCLYVLRMSMSGSR